MQVCGDQVVPGARNDGDWVIITWGSHGNDRAYHMAVGTRLILGPTTAGIGY